MKGSGHSKILIVKKLTHLGNSDENIGREGTTISPDALENIIDY